MLFLLFLTCTRWIPHHMLWTARLLVTAPKPSCLAIGCPAYALHHLYFDLLIPTLTSHLARWLVNHPTNHTVWMLHIWINLPRCTPRHAMADHNLGVLLTKWTHTPRSIRARNFAVIRLLLFDCTQMLPWHDVFGYAAGLLPNNATSVVYTDENGQVLGTCSCVYPLPNPRRSCLSLLLHHTFPIFSPASLKCKL